LGEFDGVKNIGLRPMLRYYALSGLYSSVLFNDGLHPSLKYFTLSGFDVCISTPKP
jgi:hypothetical protein